MRDELDKPLVRHRIEEAAYVQIEHPVHLLRQQSRVKRIQRIMLASLRTEPVRKSEEVRFVDSVHHLNRRTLDDLVFQRRNSERISLGQTSPLHPLRRQLPGLVRGIHRYYRSVRLPAFVHHRRTSSDFPMRPRTSSALGERGTSRFPCEVFRYVLGVCDRAGLESTSRLRCIRWSLPLSPTASASRRICLSRLNTRPAPSPVNASTPPSRATPHDSEPVWFAKTSLYETFIHYTSPV